MYEFMCLPLTNRKLGYDYLCTFVFSSFLNTCISLMSKQKLYVLGSWYQYV